MEPRPPRPHQPGEPTRWNDEPATAGAGGGAGGAPPPGGGSYLPPSYPYGSSEGGPPPETPRPGDRRRMILGTIFAVVALLIVAALVLFAVDRGRNDDNNGKATQQAALTATRSSELAAAASAAAVLTKAAAVPTATPTQVATPTPTKPPATPTPPTLPTVPVAAAATPTPTSTPEPAQHAAHIADMLPADSDVPQGLVQIGNGTRTLDEAAQSFTNPADATAKLQQWGWMGNVYKQYGIPDNVTPDPNTTTFIDVSIHRFATANATEQALAYFAGDVATSQGLHQINVPKIGDHEQALTGAPNQANLVVIYIQRDSILYRVAGSSPTGDPTNDVVAVAKKVVAK